MKKAIYSICIMLGLCTLSACQAAKEQSDIVIMPTQPEPVFNEGTQQNNPGSLFAESDIEPLFSDSRARRVGDIVVINIVETSSASSDANTDADKENSNNYGVSAFFGQSQVQMLPYLPTGGRLSGSTGNNPIFQTSSVSDFSAGGSTDRSNNVTASLSARVIRVLPGGILQLEAVRQIRVNEETQYMVVSGTIRARDIAQDNSISSVQMADANIQYYGKGVLADKQKPGWFTRFMDNLWPF